MFLNIHFHVAHTCLTTNFLNKLMYAQSIIFVKLDITRYISDTFYLLRSANKLKFKINLRLTSTSLTKKLNKFLKLLLGYYSSNVSKYQLLLKL